jgi:hypothetical protein
MGPVGLSLVAAAITAVGFAAISLADNGGGNQDGSGGDTALPAPPPGAPGAPGGPGVVLRANLSAEDRQKMDDFRQCMQDNGAPAPPRIQPGDGPPKPPSSDEIEKVQKAYEACKSKLPEDLQKAGFPPFGHPPCGPPPGAEGQRNQEQGQEQNQDQSFQAPVPAPSGASS